MAADPEDKNGLERAIEVVAAVSLSLAALLTSWSVYQSARWTTVQAADYARTGALRTRWATASNAADQLEAEDIFQFSQWLNAYASSNQALQTFYHARFRPEFRAAFDAWVASNPHDNPNAPPTPFVMPEYQVAARGEAQGLDGQAEAMFKSGQQAKDTGDSFVEGNVILASAMFFGGIAQVFRFRVVRMLLIAVSVAACFFGALRVLTLPIP